MYYRATVDDRGDETMTLSTQLTVTMIVFLLLTDCALDLRAHSHVEASAFVTGIVAVFVIAVLRVLPAYLLTPFAVAEPIMLREGRKTRIVRTRLPAEAPSRDPNLRNAEKHPAPATS
jgi:hypothetical protein